MFDGIVDHKLLRTHQVRYDVELLPYDAAWLASAVLLAGILVITIAPAAITLMGGAAWWLPRWLDRALPRLAIEREQAS